MRKAVAYEALARELERWRSMPAAELIASIGPPVNRPLVHIDGEDIAIEITVQRLDPDAVRVTAVANGPNHWRLERLVESLVVRLPRDR